jgi:two-component system sensor kinase FixL
LNQGVAVQTELAPNPPILQGDRVGLQQVLLNLVMNACDAMAGMAPDKRRLTIRTDLAGRDHVRIAVSDCGTGIPPEKVDQIFDAFYTSKPHGSGLGLAVCRTIITAHGGTLWATNNPAGGATFHFRLPVKEEVRDDERGKAWRDESTAGDELGPGAQGGRP